jgi:rare lipoprotein A
LTRQSSREIFTAAAPLPFIADSFEEKCSMPRKSVMSAPLLTRVSAGVLALASSWALAQPASAPAPAAVAPAAATAAPAPAAPAAAPAPAARTVNADSSEGKVAWYGKKFAGRKTANGERFNPNAMTMAHKTLPFGTKVKVTNLANKKSVTVRVNDRGPVTPDRIGDLSQGAARKIGMLRAGVVNARLDVVGG